MMRTKGQKKERKKTKKCSENIKGKNISQSAQMLKMDQQENLIYMKTKQKKEGKKYRGYHLK